MTDPILQLILKTVDETKGDVKDIQVRVVKLETAQAVASAKTSQRNRYLKHAVTGIVAFCSAIAGMLGVGFVG